ncbi:MAG: hypothetical protein IJW17_13755 [Lentisphaeria bacterium]|nr:hypothetical protein [Lentisphaeria bacterium]
MSKEDNSPAISFFSFQDIITSITGIMFLVVMMLVLMILSRSNSASPAEKQVQKDLKQLKQEIGLLRETLDELRRQNEPLQKRVAELQQVRLDTLPELKQTLIGKLQSADERIKQAKEEEKEIRQLCSSERAAAEKTAAGKLRLAEENRNLAKQLRQLEKSFVQQEKQSRLYQKIFQLAWDKNSLKQPLFLECSSQGIVAGTPVDPAGVRSFRTLDECVAWCRTFPTESVCFILLVKPSAFSYGEKLSRELQKAGFERGREVLPDETGLLPQGVEK